ncbi:hypothetical protein JTE90_023913 [Oedothorax gibbosus]|uniref:Uncharacterized protein n=1 Tax=Oedothorax gibbosus TaxID=931172 RepID=A0AAV6UM94_9ARAC|nr:hypothetical protein JTE90_023913 [Oedothorax gibbosus]
MRPQPTDCSNSRELISDVSRSRGKAVLLPTAIVKVEDSSEAHQEASMLLDSGSEGSFVSEACRRCIDKYGCPKEDRKFQAIVWKEDPGSDITDYKLNTVTYGLSSSSFLATRCLKQIAAENKDTFSEASFKIENNFYMADLLSGSENLDDVLSSIPLLDSSFHSSLIENRGFKLRKWHSNSSELLKIVAPIQESLVNFEIQTSDFQKSFRDSVFFHSPYHQQIPREVQQQGGSRSSPAEVPQTRPAELKCIGATAALARAPILLQVGLDLHLFLKSAGANKNERLHNSYCITSVISKSYTIRSSGVLVAVDVDGNIRDLSEEVLHDLGEVPGGHGPVQTLVFIANRTSEILETTSNDRWLFVPSQDNPADIASRGLSPDKLLLAICDGSGLPFCTPKWFAHPRYPKVPRWT